MSAPMVSGALTADQLDTLRHMLGINTPDDPRPKPCRDYYCANPGDKQLHALQGLGMVELYDKRVGYEWFRCTPAGRAAAMASHRSIRNSKAKRVYSKFLDCREVMGELTFKRFLKDPQFVQTRRDA